MKKVVYTIFFVPCFVYAQHTYLLSYPRSGNTWLRYCIEVLTQRPTYYVRDFGMVADKPLSFLAGHALDVNKLPVLKIHERADLRLSGCDYTRDKLIFIVRNPKEALIRRALATGSYYDSERFLQDMKLYFDNVQIFHEWPSARKLLIYYEDLMASPRTSLLKVLEFLDDSSESLDIFFEHFEEHKNNALALYTHLGESMTRGEDVLYHSSKLSEKEYVTLDQLIKDNNPFLCDRYLSRYFAIIK